MSLDLTAEALMAVTGLWPTEAPSTARILAAEGLEARWRGRIRRWMKGEQKPPKWVPAPQDQTKLQAKILAPLDPGVTEAWVHVLGDTELAAAYVVLVKSARDYLNGQWPKIELPGVIPDVLPLPPDELAEVWSLLRVLDDPDTLFDELDAWTLAPSQALAFKTIYPELFAQVDAAIDDEIVEHVIRGRALPWQIEDLIRIFRAQPPEARIEMPAAAQAPQPQPENKAWEIDFKARRTPSERVNAGGP